MALFKKNKPARTAASDDREIVADLDALVTKSIRFRFLDRVHEIRPVTTGKLLEVYAAFHEIDLLSKRAEISADELMERYHQLFHSVCETIDLDAVGKMTQQQSAALFGLILEAVTGKVVSSEKKSP